MQSRPTGLPQDEEGGVSYTTTTDYCRLYRARLCLVLTLSISTLLVSRNDPFKQGIFSCRIRLCRCWFCFVFVFRSCRIPIDMFLVSGGSSAILPIIKTFCDIDDIVPTSEHFTYLEGYHWAPGTRRMQLEKQTKSLIVACLPAHFPETQLSLQKVFPKLCSIPSINSESTVGKIEDWKWFSLHFGPKP